MNYKLGVIGCGFMATAIIDGVLSSKVLEQKDILCYDKMEGALNKMQGKGLQTTFDLKELARECEYVLLAVKPQNLDEVILSLEGQKINKAVSIMAGAKKEKISKGTGAIVARAMPNTPCSISKGAIGIDLSSFDGEDKKFILSLFSGVGEVVEVNSEENLNAVTGISGSGPAYVYLFIDGLIKAGIEQGLDAEQAKTLAVNTVIGAGEMVKFNKDTELSSLITAVCSKGGTTIQAVDSFNADGLDKIISKAVDKCVVRAKEVSKL